MSDASFLSPKAQLLRVKKKENFRLLVSLLITNIFTMLLCQTKLDPAPIIVDQVVSLHHDHIWVKGQMDIFVPFKNKELTPITILNAEGEVIIAKAYLYEKIEDTSSELWGANQDSNFYNIQIPAHQMNQFIKYTHQPLFAYPYFKEYQEKSMTVTPRSAHEIHF